MAFYRTVGQLKDDISGLLSGLNLNNVVNLNGAIQRAARNLVQKADIPEVMGRESINFYDGIYDYAAPSTIFGGTLLDIRAQGQNRTITDYVYKKPISDLDRTKHLLPNGYMVAFEYSQGVGRMRVAQVKAKAKIVLDYMNDTTGWAVAGNASSLSLDKAVYYWNSGSLRFNLASGGSSGTLTKTLTSQVDLTDYKNLGVVFLALHIPSTTPLTSITLKIGSDASNYFSVSATQAFLGSFKASEFQMISFDLAGSTETGSVDITKIKYIQLTFAYNGTVMTNVRCGALFISLPSPHEVLFESAAIFQTSGSNSAKTIANDNDSIILNENAYNLFEYECALTIALQTGGGQATPLAQNFHSILHGIRTNRGAVVQAGLYDLYRADNPSEELRLIGNYYND